MTENPSILVKYDSKKFLKYVVFELNRSTNSDFELRNLVRKWSNVFKKI